MTYVHRVGGDHTHTHTPRRALTIQTDGRQQGPMSKRERKPKRVAGDEIAHRVKIIASALLFVLWVPRFSLAVFSRRYAATWNHNITSG